MPIPSAESPADAARRMIEANSYLTLATADASGRPWATPVWFAHAESEAGYEFVWVSKPGARHSQNVAARPEIAIVVYDSTVPVGGAAASSPGTGSATASHPGPDTTARRWRASRRATRARRARRCPRAP